MSTMKKTVAFKLNGKVENKEQKHTHTGLEYTHTHTRTQRQTDAK